MLQIPEVDNEHCALVKIFQEIPETLVPASLGLGELVPRERVQQRISGHGLPVCGELIPREREQRRTAGDVVDVPAPQFVEDAVQCSTSYVCRCGGGTCGGCSHAWSGFAH